MENVENYLDKVQGFFDRNESHIDAFCIYFLAFAMIYILLMVFSGVIQGIAQFMFNHSSIYRKLTSISFQIGALKSIFVVIAISLIASFVLFMFLAYFIYQDNKRKQKQIRHMNRVNLMKKTQEEEYAANKRNKMFYARRLAQEISEEKRSR